MSFTTNCAKLLLHDLSDHHLLEGPKHPIPIPPPTDAAGFASLADMVAESLYRPPTEIDFSRIASFLDAKHREAIDHLALLRQDPGYFEKYMIEQKEHSPVMLTDDYGQQHPDSKPENHETLWSELLSHAVADEYLTIRIFADLCSQAEALRDMQSKYLRTGSVSSDLHPTHLEALVQFQNDSWRATQ